MRSQFLTVLCIFTFLSCLLGLTDAVVSFVKTDDVAATARIERTLTPEQKKQQATEYFEDRSSGDAPMPGEPDKIRALAVAQFGYSLLTLIGAVLMFRLRRIGFWVYLLGVGVGLVVPVLLGGSEALQTSFGVFFSILFAGLYWLNIKEMR